MRDTPPNRSERESPLWLESQVQQVRQQFKAAWQSGERPQIEDFLASWQGKQRASLLKELVSLEVRLRERDGQQPLESEYLERFSSDVEQIHEVFGLSDTVDTIDQHAETIDHSLKRRVLVGRCPRCKTKIQLSEGPSPEKIRCLNCGGVFRLAKNSPEQASQARKLAHFQLLEQLGSGSFGTVWRARDTKLDRIVAVKIPRRDRIDPQDVDNFFREARAASQLKHPNIVSVHEVGREGDTVFIVSDYIAGASLSDWLKTQQTSSREMTLLCRKLALALHHAHQAGVVHRDLKPGNIMIDGQGEPHIMDFGLAKRDSGEMTVTVEGQLVGTPAYMSPEQARGESHKADRRSDVYALGVILFELLTGERPFRGSARMLLKQVLEDEPPSPRRLNSKVSKDLETICLKCLEKEPARRYRTAAELADEFGRVERGRPIKARPISRLERGWRWCRRNPLAASVAASVLILGSVALGYTQTRPAFLEISANPANAEVVLDGRTIKLTDGQALVEFSPGKFDLEVRSKGYRSHRQQVVLARGRGNATMLNVELRAQFGYVNAESSPANADVEVVASSGKIIGRGVTPFHSARLPSGTYKLRIRKELFQPLETDVVVPDGERVVKVESLALKPRVTGASSYETFRWMRKQIEKPISKAWDFQRTPLSEVAASIGKTENIVVSIDTRAIDDVGIGSDTPITRKFEDGALGANLSRLLRELDLTWLPSVRGDRLGIEFSTPEEAESRLLTVVYPVNDLIGTQGTFHSSDLRKAIVSTVYPNTWDQVGGPGNLSFQDFTSTLTVMQTWPVHNQLYVYLESLRKTGASELAKRSSKSPTAGPAGGPNSSSTVPQFQTIYNSIQLRNLRASEGPFYSGDTIDISYELANNSGEDLRLPRGNFHVPGVRQHALELINLKRPEGPPASNGKPRSSAGTSRKTISLGGASVVHPKAVISKTSVTFFRVPFSTTLGKNHLPAGKYRFHVVFTPLGIGARPQSLSLEFELLPRDKKEEVSDGASTGYGTDEVKVSDSIDSKDIKITANHALDFDGKTSYVQLPEVNKDGAHPLTVEAYLTPRTINPVNGFVISNDRPGSGSALILSAEGKWKFAVAVGKTFRTAKTQKTEMGRTAHVAGVFDGMTLRLFVDGKLEGTLRTSGRAVSTGGAPFVLAGKPGGDGIVRGAFFDGLIDEIRISKIARYDKVFTPQKRFESDQHTLALYHFDEGQGDLLRDASGNNHHGKIVGAKWVRQEKSAVQRPPMENAPLRIP